MPTSSSKPASKGGRNDRCECNSGKKVKACCGEKKAKKPAVQNTLTAAQQELLNPAQSTMKAYIKNLNDTAGKLAEDLFEVPGSGIDDVAVVTENVNTPGKFRSYVQLVGPGATREPQSSSAPCERYEEALQELIVNLQVRLEAKEVAAYKSAREKRDEADDDDEDEDI